MSTGRGDTTLTDRLRKPWTRPVFARCAYVLLVVAALLGSRAVAADTYRVFGGVVAAEPAPPGSGLVDADVVPTPLSTAERVAPPDVVATQDLAMVRVEVVASDGTVLGEDLATLGGYFVQFQGPPPSTTLSVRFRITEAVTGKLIYETGESPLAGGQVPDAGALSFRRYLLVPAEGLQVGGPIDHPGGPLDAFLLTRVGSLLPGSDIGTDGLADPPGFGSSWQHAPFGGRLDLFGAASFKFYPPGGDYCYRLLADAQTLDDPLFKTRYTLRHQGGTVTLETERVKLGPFTLNGVADCYRFTPTSGPPAGGEQVFWSYPDLLMRWDTTDLANGKYDLSFEIHNANGGTVLSGQALTVELDNVPVTAQIHDVSGGSKVGACDEIDLGGSNPPPLTVELEVQDAADHLATWSLTAVANDAATASKWLPAAGTKPSVVPGHVTHTQAVGTGGLDHACVYTVRLSASKKTTNGYGPIFHAAASESRYVVTP